MPRKCPACGYPNPDGLSHCFKCQTMLAAPKPPYPPPTTVPTAPPAPTLPPASTQPVQQEPQPAKRAPSLTLLGVIATLLVVIGAGMVVYFMFMFDTSVEVPGAEALGISSGRVNNIGLLSDRQNGIVCGFGFAFFGVIMGAWDHFARSR